MENIIFLFLICGYGVFLIWYILYASNKVEYYKFLASKYSSCGSYEHPVFIGSGLDNNVVCYLSGNPENKYIGDYPLTLIIDGTGKMRDFCSDERPWNRCRLEIGKVVIKKGISYIGAFAFEDMPALVNVLCGEDVKEIGNGAFLNCKSLCHVKCLSNASIKYSPFSFPDGFNFEESIE